MLFRSSFDGLSKIAGGPKRTPRHDELGDPSGPTLFAVLAQDAFDLDYIRSVDDMSGRQRRGRIHAHVEWTVGAEAEAAFRIVDLGARETEVEEDQVGGHEAVFGSDVGELGKTAMDDHHGGTEVAQRLAAGLRRQGIAVDPEQPATGCDPLQDLAGVTRLPERAVDRDRARPGLEQLYYLL